MSSLLISLSYTYGKKAFLYKTICLSRLAMDSDSVLVLNWTIKLYLMENLHTGFRLHSYITPSIKCIANAGLSLKCFGWKVTSKQRLVYEVQKQFGVCQAIQLPTSVLSENQFYPRDLSSFS